MVQIKIPKEKALWLTPVIYLTLIFSSLILGYIFKDDVFSVFEDMEDFIDRNQALAVFLFYLWWMIIAVGGPPGNTTTTFVCGFFFGWWALLVAQISLH